MRSLPEFRFYQGIVDDLDFSWLPDLYYTLAYGEKFPSFEVSRELMDSTEQFLGVAMCDMTQQQMQSVVDRILHTREMRREILIWTNSDSKPQIIDTAKVVKSGYAYLIRPYMDRTAIMQEVLEKLED
jgi:hypothetical protein